MFIPPINGSSSRSFPAGARRNPSSGRPSSSPMFSFSTPNWRAANNSFLPKTMSSSSSRPSYGGGGRMTSSYHQDWSSSRPSYSGLSSHNTSQSRYSSSDRLNSSTRFTSGTDHCTGVGAVSNYASAGSSTSRFVSPLSTSGGGGMSLGTPKRSASYASGIGLGEPRNDYCSYSTRRTAGGISDSSYYGGNKRNGGGNSFLMTSSLYANPSGFRLPSRGGLPSYTSSTGLDSSTSYRSSMDRDFGQLGGRNLTANATTPTMDTTQREKKENIKMKEELEEGEGMNTEEEASKRRKQSLTPADIKSKSASPVPTSPDSQQDSNGEEKMMRSPTAPSGIGVRASSSSLIPKDSSKSKSHSPSTAVEETERTTGEDILGQNLSMQNLSNVEIPPSSVNALPAFSQLERMIKLASFDQRSFQKQIRIARANKSQKEENLPELTRKGSQSPTLAKKSSSPRKLSSRSPSPCPKEKSQSSRSPTPNQQLKSKGGRRSVENLMEEVRANEHGRGEGGGNKACEHDDEAQSKDKLRPPPLLLVTSPSMQAHGEEEGEDVAMGDAAATAEMTVNLAGEEEEEGDFDEDEEYSDEEDFSDEDYSDEEEWESDWDVDEATVCRTLQVSGLSIPFSSDYESDFELPFELNKTKEKGRLPEGNMLPPPIFTASISYDGMSDSWGHSYSDEGSWTGCSGGVGGDEPEVGFTLVQRAAMRASDEEFTTTTSSGSYTSESYTTTTTSSSFDEEEDGEGTEEEISRRSYTRSRSLDERSISRSRRSSSSTESGEEAESVHSDDKELVRKEEVAKEGPKLIVLMPNEAMEAEEPELDSAQLIEEKPMEMGGSEELQADELDNDAKEFLRETTFVREQQVKEGGTVESAHPLTGQAKPRTDFAKKAVVQPMKVEKARVAELEKPLQAPTGEEIRRKEAAEEAKRKAEEAKKQQEQEAKRKKMEEEKEEAKKKSEKTKMEEQQQQKVDKSAQRKSTLNMSEQEKKKAEQEEQERVRQQARGSGAVDKMRSRFQPSEPILPIVITNEPIVYKRSSRLDPKPVDEQRQKRAFTPIQMPESDDKFDKEVAELREQMKKGTRKLQNVARDVSSGLKCATTEAKQRAKEEEHKIVMDKASNAFGRAEEEKKRRKEQRETEEEKKVRERTDKERKQAERKEKEKLEVSDRITEEPKRPEPKKTIRRAAKEPKSADETANKEEGKKEDGRAPPKRYGDRPEAKKKTEELMRFTTVKEEPMAATARVAEAGLDLKVQQEKQQQKGAETLIRSSKGRTKVKRRNARRGHRRRPFIRIPFDIDELMGWQGMDSFEKMDAFFASRGAEKRQMKDEMSAGPAPKRRGTEPQKVWISELHDIDKLYRTSELRDIKLSAGA